MEEASDAPDGSADIPVREFNRAGWKARAPLRYILAKISFSTRVRLCAMAGWSMFLAISA